MQKVKIFPSNRLIQIGFIVFGILSGTILGGSFVILDSAGAFSPYSKASWELIESPIKFKHIANATTRKVWAVTEAGKYYCLGIPECDQWTETEEVTVNSHQEYDRTTINKNTCTPNGIYPNDPNGNVVECALSDVYIGIETRSIVYYALLDDGTLWTWKSSGPWYVGFGMFVVLISPFIGLFLGVLMYKLFQKYKQNKSV